MHRSGRGWTAVQTRFVAEPDRAISAADDLVTRLIAERGYPTGYDDRVAQLSVDHARTLQQYRTAHDIHSASTR